MHHPMYRRAFITTLVLLIGLTAAIQAPVAGASRVYTPAKGKKCRKGYRAVKRHGKRRCVKRRVNAPARLGDLVLRAHLGPPNRNPDDPFQVSYPISASADQGGAPAATPEGVLELFSDGALECAVQIGSGLTAADCPVRYLALGIHRTTVIFQSGSASATETRLFQIDPLPITTSLSAAFEAAPPHELSPGLWQVGTIHLEAGASPPGTPQLSCSSELFGGEQIPGCIGDLPSGLVKGKLDVPVTLMIWGFEEVAPEEFNRILKVGIPSSGAEGKRLMYLDEAAAGSVFFRAQTAPSPGYVGSAATAPLVIEQVNLPGWFDFRHVGPVAVTDQLAHFIDIGTYNKLDADTQLRVRAGLEAGNGFSEDCRFQLRVDGVPVPGELWKGGSNGVGIENTATLDDLPAGTHTLSLWVKTVSSEADPQCQLNEAGFVASE